MVETLPAHFAVYIKRLRDAAAVAEKTGDTRSVVARAEEVLRLPDVGRFPDFQATVGLERLYAICTGRMGISASQAEESLRDLSAVKAASVVSSNSRWRPIVSLVEAASCLRLAVEFGDAAMFVRTSAAANKATNRPALESLSAIGSLIGLRAEYFKHMLDVTSSGQARGLSDLQSALRLILRDEASEALDRRPYMAKSFRISAAGSLYSLWKADRTEGDNLKNLNEAFAFALIAAIDPPDSCGPPYIFPGEVALTMLPIIVSAIGPASENEGGRFKNELEVLLSRIRNAYGEGGWRGLKDASRTLAGLASSDSTLRYALFGPGRQQTQDELQLLLIGLESAAKDADLAYSNASKPAGLNAGLRLVSEIIGA